MANPSWGQFLQTVNVTDIAYLACHGETGERELSQYIHAPKRRTQWELPGLRTKPEWLVRGSTMLVIAVVTAVLSGCAASTTTADPENDAPAQAAKPAAKPKAAAVPRLVGLSLAEVKVALREAGLTIGVVKREPSSRDAGTVLRQGSSPGASLDSGSPVTIVLAAPLPKLPSVVGSARFIPTGRTYPMPFWS